MTAVVGRQRALGISGSPIPDGTTDRTLRRVLEASGLEAELVRLWDIEVSPCRACLRCAGTNVCTAFEDDWLPLAVKLVRAQAVVIAGWAPFNMIDARCKAVIERAFSLRHSILLLAGKAGAAIVTGTVDPQPVAEAVLAYLTGEGLRALGTATPAGTDPCWTCGFGDTCTQGAVVPLVRGEAVPYGYRDVLRLPPAEQFVIAPAWLPPTVEDQVEVLAEADALGRRLGDAVRDAEAACAERLERLAPGSTLLTGLARLAAVVEGASSAGGPDLSLAARPVEVTQRQYANGDAQAAIVTLLKLARMVLFDASGAQAERETVVEEIRRTIAELYGPAVEGRRDMPGWTSDGVRSSDRLL
jgi:hypothetical protein